MLQSLSSKLTFVARRFRGTLHVILCWQLLFSVLLAVPITSTRISEESKAETSEPIEERVDWEETTSLFYSASISRNAAHTRRPKCRTTLRVTTGASVRGVSQSRFASFFVGHRLANGLLAPMHC